MTWLLWLIWPGPALAFLGLLLATPVYFAFSRPLDRLSVAEAAWVSWPFGLYLLVLWCLWAGPSPERRCPDAPLSVQDELKLRDPGGDVTL